MSKISIAILDDHDLIIEAIKSLIEQSENLRYSGGFKTYNALQDYLSTNTLSDILLLDIRLQDEDGITICKTLSKEHPLLKIIMLSSMTQSAIVMDALKKGAKGFLPKNISLNELNKACKEVKEERTYIHKDISLITNKNKTSKYDYIPKITRREKEVLKLIMEEQTSSEIATKLCISINTVENHRASLFSKTGSKNIVGLTKYTLEKGLLD